MQVIDAAFTAEQATHGLPPVPHEALEVPAWHELFEQQPLAQLPEPHVAGLIWQMTGVVRSSEPLVPLTVIVEAPTAAVLESKVAVEDAPAATGFGLNLKVALRGTFKADSVTLELKEPEGVTVMLDEPEAPWVTVNSPGFADKTKF